jgi:signal transduction histidine kinase
LSVTVRVGSRPGKEATGVNTSSGSIVGEDEVELSSARTERRGILWVVWGLSISLLLGAMVFAVAGRSYQGAGGTPLLERLVLLFPAMVAFPTVGALIVSRFPRHRVGWLFLSAGVSGGGGAFAEGYATYAVVLRPGSLPMGEVAAWAAAWFYAMGTGTLLLAFLLFPDGRLPSPRWRILLWLLVIGLLGEVALQAFSPGLLRGGVPIQNPFGLSLLVRASEVVNVLHVGVVLGGVGTVAALLSRLHGSEGVARRRLKWVVLSGVPATGAFLLYLILEPWPGIARVMSGINFVGFSLVAVAAGIAILRHRLFDIDLLINRTIVFGTLTTIVVGLYVLVVGSLGVLFQVRANLAISLVATGVVAVLFQPLRDRLQRAVNRLMFGERDDPYGVLSRLGAHLEATLAPQAVLPTIVRTVAEALRLPYVAIVLGEDGDARPSAAFGDPIAERVLVPLAYQGSVVGQLLVSPRAPGESFSPAERRLLTDLARQAGVAVSAVRLTEDLQRSRRRLVTALEEERRRLRRDLHDGIGPALAAVALKVETARNRFAAHGSGGELFDDLSGRMQEIVASLRHLVYGLRPPILDDLGLVAAIGEAAARCQEGGLVVTIDAPDELPSLPAAVDLAAYRIAQEALTNVIRHAQAQTCRVRVSLDGVLRLEIRDDGRGIPDIPNAGVGLASMRERAEELGGTFLVEPARPHGTRVLVRLPQSSDMPLAAGKTLPSARAAEASG